MDVAGTGGFDWRTQYAQSQRTRQSLPDDKKNVPIEPTPAAADFGNDVVNSFMNFVQKTPEQRFQDAWLSRHGITREEFDAMTPEEKQKLLDEMKQEMDAQMKEKLKEKNAGKTDIVA